MNLIIKPTQRCNFACKYCSSTDIAKSNTAHDDLELHKIFRFLDRYPKTSQIIINGGDPLMMPPDYYFTLLDYIESNSLPTTLEFCSNLWDYYKKPKKWAKLFSHEKVNIGTSFNYGEERILPDGRILTESLFLDIIYKFKNEFGHFPPFVAVVTNENISRAIDNVRLAKELNVVCKLNFELNSGRAAGGVTLGKMYHIYLQIFKEGLSDFESNTDIIIKKIKGIESNMCPHNRKCDEGIRNLQPESQSGYSYNSCGAFGDDQKYEINFEAEMQGGFFTPLQSALEIQYQKEECLSCPNFSFCNGCYKTVSDHKRLGLVEESCIEMKSFRKEILKMGLV